MRSTALSVNVNKIAVLRNSRGGNLPDPVRAALLCIEAGCAGITVHPRPDGRHIRHDDVQQLSALCRDRVEFNVEGNPFAPARKGYSGLLPIADEFRPQQITLVPDDDSQLTSDHGFSFDSNDCRRLAPLVGHLKSWGIRVSVFVDANCERLAAARDIGVDRVELYTGPFALAHVQGGSDLDVSLANYADAARRALDLGLEVNAGHDLSLANLGAFLNVVVGVSEVSIGHALIAEALELGLAETVRLYRDVIASALPDAGRREPRSR